MSVPLKPESNISSGKTGVFFPFFFAGGGFVFDWLPICNCGQPAASQGASREKKKCGERPYRANSVSMVNNFAEIFLSSLASQSSSGTWLEWKEKPKPKPKQKTPNRTAGKNNLWKWQPCERIPLLADFRGTHQAWYYVTHGATNTVLVKTDGLYLKCCTGKVGGYTCPDFRWGATKLPTQNWPLFSAPFLCWISLTSVEDRAVTFMVFSAPWCSISCYLLGNGTDQK